MGVKPGKAHFIPSQVLLGSYLTSAQTRSPMGIEQFPTEASLLMSGESISLELAL